jgi:surfeit locus 1 family protein
MAKPQQYFSGIAAGSHEITIGRLHIRFNWLIALCVLLSCAMFINLGFWQLGRAADKRQLQRDAVVQEQAEPVPLESLFTAASSTAAGAAAEAASSLNNRRVSLRGEYVNDAAFLVVFQFFQGQPGFELISPFRLASDGSLVLVSRGWIAPGPDAGSLPVIQTVEQQQTLVGQLHVPDVATVASQIEEREWPVRVRRLHIPQVEALLGEPVYPWQVRLNTGSPGLLARHWPTVTISTRSNIGYALQWFSFALLTVVVSLLMSSNLLQLLRKDRSAGA